MHTNLTRRFRSICVPIIIFASLLTPTALFCAEFDAQQSGCGTQQAFDLRLKAHGSAMSSTSGTCPRNGDCDDPAFRNLYLGGGHFDVVHLYFQVLCLDDGSNPAATVSEVATQVDSLNSDFSPYGFRFEYDMRFVNSTQYRFLTSFADGETMKSTYAIDPAHTLNVFVTTNAFCLCSYATYPWDPAALTSQGGIVMTRERFYPQSRTGASLTHEIGHCLGLWHTQRGVSEVPACGACYESVGATDRDLSGDFCEDTDPTPSNAKSAPPGGEDMCSGLPWGTTDYKNYMGYGPDLNLSEFSPEQTARMHCWTSSSLSSFIKSTAPLDTLFGSAPMTVNLVGRLDRPVTQWHWDFGDGQTSDEQNPEHTFARAGVFDIRCTAVADNEAYVIDSLPRVYATGDTLVVGSRMADTSASVRIDISINNRVPLSRLVIPLTWDGPFGLKIDSVTTTGLRTVNLTIANGGIAVVGEQPEQRRMTVILEANIVQPIPPGSGKILALYVHTPPIMYSQVNPIRIAAYDSYIPTLTTIPGDYSPQVVNGSLTLGCCEGLTGNIDDDPSGIVDVSDLTTLIMSLFIDFRPLPCEREANVDGDVEGRVDIADLTQLVDFLYIALTPTAPCR